MQVVGEPWRRHCHHNQYGALGSDAGALAALNHRRIDSCHAYGGKSPTFTAALQMITKSAVTETSG